MYILALTFIHTVNTAVTWEEGCSSYPGRSYKGSRQEGCNIPQEQTCQQWQVEL